MTKVPKQLQEESLNNILDIARKMLSEELNLVIGSREIDRLRHNLEDAEDERFNIFLVVVSDTDRFPVEEDVRKRWNKESLENLDKELEEYLNDTKAEVLKGCRTLIESYTN